MFSVKFDFCNFSGQGKGAYWKKHIVPMKLQSYKVTKNKRVTKLQSYKMDEDDDHAETKHMLL